MTMADVQYFDGVTRTLGFKVFGAMDGSQWVVTEAGTAIPGMVFGRPIDAVEQANAMQCRRWHDAARN